MPRKFIDKKKAATFHLVHRSHRDPLINDPESSSRVLKYVPPTNSKTVPGSSKDPPLADGSKGPITRSILEETVDVDAVRENEGQAAEYGIYFDDSEYDYMQHLRSVGDVPDGILLEAPASNKGKGKAKEVVFGEKVLSLSPISFHFVFAGRVSWFDYGNKLIIAWSSERSPPQ